MRRLFFAAAFLLFVCVPNARATTIDFDSLTDLDVVTNQFADATFANATVLTAGVSLNELEFPPRSGSNVVFDDGGAMSISFATPLESFAGYFTHSVALTLTAFSPANVALGSVTSAFASNLAVSGDAGSTPNELLQVTFASGVGSVTITGDIFGGSFVLDDVTLTPLQVGPGPEPIPEPGTLSLLSLGVAWIARRRMSRGC